MYFHIIPKFILVRQEFKYFVLNKYFSCSQFRKILLVFVILSKTVTGRKEMRKRLFKLSDSFIYFHCSFFYWTREVLEVVSYLFVLFFNLKLIILYKIFFWIRKLSQTINNNGDGDCYANNFYVISVLFFAIFFLKSEIIHREFLFNLDILAYLYFNY